MSSREDLENGYDSQGGNYQLPLNEHVTAPSEVVGEWYNSILECQFRILENGIIERHLSKIAQSQKKQHSPWVPWTDKDVLTKGGKGVLTGYQLQRHILAKLMMPNASKNDRAKLEQDLGSLNLLELVDAHDKLRDKPFTGRKSYIRTIQNELKSKKATRDSNYDNVGKLENDQIRYSEHDLSVANPDTGTFWQGRVLELAPTNISENLGLRLVGSNLIKKAWFYEDTNGNWKLFDGFNITENGDVVPDSLKSDLLLENGLLPRYKALSDKVNAMTLDTSPTVQEGEEDDNNLKLSVDEFNFDFATTPHIPATNTDRIIDWFTDSKQDFTDKEAGFVAVQNLEDEGKLALFNDLDNLDLDNITEVANFITDNHGVPAGNPSLATNLASLRTVVEGLNERGVSEQDGENFTGYKRPVYRNGTHVPYKAMTQKERDAFRNHWDNLYDRPLGWLHHTPEGRELWQETVDEYSEYSKEQEIKDREFIEREFAALGIPIKDNKFTDGVLKGLSVEAACDELIKEADALDDLELSTDPDASKPENVAPLTTGLEPHQQEWLHELKTSEDAGYNPEQIFGSDIWSHLEKGNYQGIGEAAPPGLTQRRELLFGSTGQDWYRRLGERQAEQYLIGMPLAGSSEDGTSAYEIYRQAEDDGRGIAIVDGIEYPIDELHKRRVGGIIQVTDVDEEGNFVISADGTSVNAPTSITTGDKDFVASFTEYLGYTMVDKLVRDGVLSEEYATGGVKRRDGVGVPVAPKIGTEDNDALIVAINNILRDYKSMRGTDNEEGMYRFEEIPGDTYAAFTRGTYNVGKKKYEKSSHVLNILYNYLNESGHLKDELYRATGGKEGQTIGNLEYKKDELLDRIDAAKDKKAELNDIIEETNEVLAGSDGGDFDPPTGKILGAADEEEDPKDEASQNAGTVWGVLNDYMKEKAAEAAAQGNLEDEGYLAEIAELGGQRDRAREQMLLSIENNANNFLNTNPQFVAYKEQIEQRHYSEVLQNAPLNIRATAFRNRIDGLNTRLDQAETQGDLHDIARDWARTGLVEYNDILNVDRDGASKLQRLRRKLENTNGVDWTAIDKEYTEYLNNKNDADNMILGVQENIDAMEASGLTTQRGEKESDFTPAEWAKKEEADARLKGLKKYLRGLQSQPRYSYGSQEHIADLKGHPSSQGIYQTLDNTGIEDIDTSLYEGMKTAPNPIADIFRTGLNAYTENRLLGNSPITGLLQALTASIGEGTGIGGDRIRGLDIRKPIDEHKADYGGSWFDWLRPLPIFWGGKVKDARKKEAGRRGEIYTPEPTVESEIYVGNEPTGVTYEQAMDATQANIRTEMPPIPPDVDATPTTPTTPPTPQPNTEEET